MMTIIWMFQDDRGLRPSLAGLALPTGQLYSVTYNTSTQTITTAALTISGMTASNKTYDATTAGILNNGSDSGNVGLVTT